MIKFSVITCTYNAEKEIERTLESVRSQSYPDVEHVVIDGMSKDQTMTIVNRYAESCSTVVVVSEKDRGLYDAMNKGISKATGDYVIFLNAGDKFHTNETLSDIASKITNEKELPGVVYGNTDIVDDRGNFLHKRRLTPPEVLLWKSFSDGMLVCHQSFYADTKIAKQIPYDLKYRFSADVDWCIRIMKECERRGLQLYNGHMVLTDYLDGGMTMKNHRASLIERFKVMAHHYGLVKTIIKHIGFLLR